MHKLEIIERVNKVVSETFQIPITELSPSLRVKEDLGADSIQVVALMIALDAEFDIEFCVEKIPSQGVSIGWICEFVRDSLPETGSHN